MHDADDFHFQNEIDPEVFRASGKSLTGYRLKSIFRSWKREIDTERNPGHSHFVEGHMFTVAWTTYFGADLVRIYGLERIQHCAWDSIEHVDGCVVARLYPEPFDPERREKREVQARVRDQLGVDEVAHPLLTRPEVLARFAVDFRES